MYILRFDQIFELFLSLEINFYVMKVHIIQKSISIIRSVGGCS